MRHTSHRKIVQIASRKAFKLLYSGTLSDFSEPDTPSFIANFSMTLPVISFSRANTTPRPKRTVISFKRFAFSQNFPFDPFQISTSLLCTIFDSSTHLATLAQVALFDFPPFCLQYSCWRHVQIDHSGWLWIFEIAVNSATRTRWLSATLRVNRRSVRWRRFQRDFSLMAIRREPLPLVIALQMLLLRSQISAKLLSISVLEECPSSNT